jgi:phosphoribosylformimino-5-aminoimidazole carboxamide ribotide isomerase
MIPVLDVMGGQVVRAIGGRRSEYRPIQSRLTQSTHPADIAEAMLRAAQATEMYIADLDAITGRGAISKPVVELIHTLTCRVWVDVGIGEGADGSDLPTLPRICPVVGFETARTWEVLLETRQRKGLGPVALSIDMRAGELIGNWRGWDLSGPRDVAGLARCATRQGVGTLIVLDLTRVGTGDGCGTEPLLQSLRDEFPDVELIAGGGVRTWDHVDRLADAGADAVLIASALHDRTVMVPRPGYDNASDRSASPVNR